MFGIGISELVVIFVIALLVLGPDELPKVARTLAKWVFEFRHATEDLRLNLFSASNDKAEKKSIAPFILESIAREEPKTKETNADG